MAGLLAGFLYKTYASTYRYEVQFEDEADKKIFFFGKNLIYACFHQDDLNCLPYFANRGICILISKSKDGQILASAVEHMGYKTVRGSSHRGGVAGLLALIKSVAEGNSITIAVDGPKGPIYKVKEGITAVSDKTKIPIIPVRAFPQHKYVFEKSWNKATLPIPFTKIVLVVGKIDFYSTIGLEQKMLSLTVKH